jgi:hypothetical protein
MVGDAVSESRARRRIREAVERFGYQLVSLEWEPIGMGAEMCGPSGGWTGDIEGPEGIEYSAVMGYNVEHALDWIDDWVKPVEPCACPKADRLGRQRAQLQNHTANCRYFLTYRLPWFAG